MAMLHDPAVRASLEARLAALGPDSQRRFVSRPVVGAWPAGSTFGAVSGSFVSKLQAKHLFHHFRQFGG